jgi:predicted DCC family thiol-disulfide oxidoreductase YuxK
MSALGLGFAERVMLSRALFGAVLLGLVVLGLRHPQFVKKTWRDFWYAVGHPLNLAVYRIVLFATIFWDLDGDYPLRELIFFSELPTELRFPPRGLELITPHLPTSAALAVTGYLVVQVFAFTAMVGLFSRTSAAVVAIGGIYGMGVPQFYGQVNHYHHMLWFAAVMACSRCGDFLSIDALRLAWRRADQGIVEPPAPSREYALPIRMIWLLMGVLYFFPGFWKLWVSGLDWAFSDGFKHTLHMKWHQLEGWTPGFRLDRYPLLYQPAALVAMLFEIAFAFLIFFPKGRLVLLVFGLGFHNVTTYFMRIPFLTLQTSYVSFVDWDRGCRWLGRKLYPQMLSVLYDGSCGVCRRTIAMLRMFDVFGRIAFVNAADTADDGRHLGVERTQLMVHMHAVRGQRVWRGFEAYRAMAARIPILWPIWPLLWVWPANVLGRRVYRHVADSRRCEVPGAGGTRPGSARLAGPDWRRPVVVVTMAMILINIAYGVKHQRTGWPFSCYPPFSRIAPPVSIEMELAAFDADGERITWDEKGLIKRFTFPRWATLMERLNDEASEARYRAFWRVVAAHSPEMARAVRVEFYRDRYLTDPERRAQGPIRRDLVYTMELNGEEKAFGDGPHKMNGTESLPRPMALGG